MRPAAPVTPILNSVIARTLCFLIESKRDLTTGALEAGKIFTPAGPLEG
jgi:hypothetical protein